ncbi:hypothetical protein BSKO_00137 [Bryopsis sp. KO-2023]|nr:hypothetical protein BSKO_00137 [Bryopsis sp. KO-2023]
MAGAFSSPLNPLGSFFPKILGRNPRTKPLSSTTLLRKALLQPTSPPTLRFSSVVVTGLATTTTTATPSPTVFDLTASCDACLTVVAKVASPPRVTNAISRTVVPEFCLALPKSKKKRRGGGGGGDDGGMGDGNDGGDYFGFGGEGDEDEENARRWTMMWMVLSMYSAVQTIYFLLFGKEEKHSGPLLATVTCSLCSRIQEKYLKKGNAQLHPT